MINPSKFIRTVLIALGAIGLAVVGGTVVYAKLTAPRGGYIWILKDVSGSERGSAGAVEACVQAGIAEALANGATLKIMPIARAPVDMRAKPIVTTAPLSIRFRPRKARSHRADVQGRATGASAAISKRPTPKGSSDTIAAAAFAGKDIRDQPGPHERRTLLICGDAHQVGSGISVYNRHFTLDRARRLIHALGPDGIGDLRGIDVVFGAAYTGDVKRPLSGITESQIEKIWTQAWAPAAHPRSVAYGGTPQFPR